MKSTFNLSFYCRSSKTNKMGKAPIELSINVNGKRTFINLPQRVEPAIYEKAMSSKRNNDIKDFVNLWYTKANNAVLELTKSNTPITAENIKITLLGKEEDKLTLGVAWQKWLRHVALKVDVDIELSTFQKYMNVQKFMIAHYGKDKLMSDFTADDVEDLYIILKKKLAVNTAGKYMAKVKALFKYFNLDGIFKNIKIGKEVKDVQYLTKEEVEIITHKELYNERLGKVRDLFIFQCHTGLAFTDMQQLTKEDFKECEEGKYIRKERQKTGITYTILLLPKALEILEKYDYQLPKISNQRMNSYLGEIATICNINKPLHSHIARHTAATLFLNAGLSLDEVAKILGHSTTTQTKHYAKMLDKTVLCAMAKLK